jgi:hypothetical protein
MRSSQTWKVYAATDDPEDDEGRCEACWNAEVGRTRVIEERHEHFRHSGACTARAHAFAIRLIAMDVCWGEEWHRGADRAWD